MYRKMEKKGCKKQRVTERKYIERKRKKIHRNIQQKKKESICIDRKRKKMHRHIEGKKEEI